MKLAVLLVVSIIFLASTKAASRLDNYDFDVLSLIPTPPTRLSWFSLLLI